LPSIITIGAQLVMYTSIINNNGNMVVYWTSPVADGLTWTFGGIALLPSGSADWDNAFFVIDPFVFKNSHGFYEMAFTAETTGPSAQKVGYAISADGFFLVPIQHHANSCPEHSSNRFNAAVCR